MQAESAVQVTDANFQEEIIEYPGVALVDFWAVWCGPCKMMTPRIEELAQKYKNNPNVKIAQVNTDENEHIRELNEIRSIPTFKFYVNGQTTDADMVIGVQPTEVLENQIEALLTRLKNPTQASHAS